MPIKASGPGRDPAYEEFDGGFVWRAHPREEMQRASQALETDEGVWLIDPIDADGLDDRLADRGGLAGIAILLGRHERDAARIAARHEVPVTRPPGVDRRVDAPTRDVAGGLPGTDFEFLTVQDGPFWTEVGLWDGATLVVPESLGTNDFCRVGGERVGLNPVARVTPPRHLAEYAPERLLVGHGPSVFEDAPGAIRAALANARRRLPKALLKSARAFL